MTAAAARRPRSRWSLRRFGADRGGVSAVEFGIILPFMLTLYIGGAELGDGMAIQFKTTLAARTIADLASQYIAIDSATMSGILGAAGIVVTPYSSSNMVVTLSELTTTNSQGAATVTWSAASGGSPRTQGSSLTLPPSLRTLPSGTSLIWGEVTYPYTPSMGYVITGTINIYENTYFYPRMTNSVSCTATGANYSGCSGTN
jgi:Flp pilus assembly protein TadG